MMKPYILFIICSLSALCFAEEIPNYCHDEETNLQWKTLETKPGIHPDLVDLSKYRDEICARIDMGEIDVIEGTALFEYRRELVMDRIRKGMF